eukprot:TRINITY_DN399_c0_g1_i1.p1 TRINITY_DN399_c0_g1~~TRINITY_DN399_c0_g1_i1.p1  ORF type:complete len:117 (-),score=38.77 TRINITY_DN399_c0_g1_i1:89-439(-)
MVDPVGRVVSAFGTLKQLKNDRTKESEMERNALIELFRGDESSKKESVNSTLSLCGVKYHIFFRNHSSAYGISKRKKNGIILNNLSFGTIVSIYQRPMIAQQVIPIIENMADRLKR